MVEAFDAESWFAPVSVSFGLVNGNSPVDVTQTVDVNGAAASAVAIDFFKDPPAGVSVSAQIVDGDIAVTLSLKRKSAPRDYSGDVVVTAGGQTYLVPFWVRVTNR